MIKFRASGRDPDHPGAPDPNAPEAIDFLTSAAQLRCRPGRTSLPAVSIVASSSIVGPGAAADAANALWRTLQANQAEALGARQVFATESGHNVLLTEPELIVSAVRQVIDEARERIVVSVSTD